MKATFSRQTLLQGITLTQNAAATASTLPILANVLFEADDKGVSLVGTDLECFARVRLEARVEEAGRVTAPAKTLAEIVRSLPDDDIGLATSGSRMTLTCGRNVFHLATMPADDFPEWPKMEADTKLTMRQADLKRLLGNTLFAMPTRDPRKVLMGVLFELAEGRIVAVATDGRKLGKSTCEAVEVEGKDAASAVIPGRIFTELERALSDEGEIQMSLSGQRAVFSIESLNLTYLTSLIEGKFPAYQAVIPESFKRTIPLPKSVLNETIGRAYILAERKHHSVVLGFDSGVINVRGHSLEDGSYEGEVPIEYDGEAIKIAFNYNYLSDVLRIAPDDTLNMKIKDATAPIVFECESDPNTLYLIMPVRIHDLEAQSAEEPVGAEA